MMPKQQQQPPQKCSSRNRQSWLTYGAIVVLALALFYHLQLFDSVMAEMSQGNEKAMIKSVEEILKWYNEQNKKNYTLDGIYDFNLKMGKNAKQFSAWISVKRDKEGGKPKNFDTCKLLFDIKNGKLKFEEVSMKCYDPFGKNKPEDSSMVMLDQ